MRTRNPFQSGLAAMAMAKSLNMNIMPCILLVNAKKCSTRGKKEIKPLEV
jgi:hypothetical protein